MWECLLYLLSKTSLVVGVFQKIKIWCCSNEIMLPSLVNYHFVKSVLIRTRKNSVFGHLSHSTFDMDIVPQWVLLIQWKSSAITYSTKNCFNIFCKFTWKHQGRSCFLLTLQFVDVQLYHNRTATRVFSRKIGEICQDKYFSENLWVTDSVQSSCWYFRDMQKQPPEVFDKKGCS